MSKFVLAFQEIAKLVQEVGPKMDSAARYDDPVMIEIAPLVDRSGRVAAKTLGPFKSEQEAHNYIDIKRDRHRLANAKHFGEDGPGTIETDNHLLGHPQMTYRIVGAEAYFSRYAGQIMMTIVGALVGSLCTDYDLPFQEPTEEFGITDDEE